MSDERITLTRRKILAGTTAVGAAGIGAGFGTGALFSDQESFANNELTAGELDLHVHYESSVDQDGVSTEGTTTGEGTIDGNPAEGSYDIADVKPGDSGSIEFCFSVVDNPAFMRVEGELTENAENGQTEPEEDVDDSGGDSGDGDGELADAIDATLRYCTEGEDDPDGDVISSGSLSNVLSGLGIGVPLDGNRNSDSAERAPFPAQSQSSSTADTCVCLEWNVPTSVGNEIQTDSVGFDLSFIAEQSRHSDGIDIGSGLSGYYPLDTVQDGVADDVSGNDNDGSIEGDVSPVAGQIANAGSFDGDSGAVTTDVNVGGSNESVSLSGWLKAPSQTLNQTHFFLSNYLDRPGGGGKHGGFFAIGSNDGDTMYFWTRDQESDISTRTGSYGPAFDEEWHHYAGVRDAEAEEIRFYIDGEKKESTSFPGDVAIRDSDSFFGMMKHFDTRYLEGNVDDVLIYDRALSDAEVKTIYDDSA